MRCALFAVIALLLFAATPALADDVQKKHHVDQQIASLNARVAKQKHQEQQLRNSVAGHTQRIRALEPRVGDVSLRLTTLDAALKPPQRGLTALNKLFARQTSRYK